MKLLIGSNKAGWDLKEFILQNLLADGIQVADYSNKEDSIYNTALIITQLTIAEIDTFGLLIDDYGIESFMVATKCKGAIAAQVADEHSARMTRDHNNAKVITLGSEITGNSLALNIAKAFCQGNYSGGRHQIRIDMLNNML